MKLGICKLSESHLTCKYKCGITFPGKITRKEEVRRGDMFLNSVERDICSSPVEFVPMPYTNIPGLHYKRSCEYLEIKDVEDS